MSKPSVLLSRAWIFVLLVASGYLIWANRVQIDRAEYVTGIAQEDHPTSTTSPTGYAEGTRELIVPEHIDESYQWIAQTQQMFARGEWRVREIPYENAPFGRAVHSASPYRWWLGGIAWIDHVISGRSLSSSVERAALYADPLLHLLLLVATTLFVARFFGSVAASVISIGMVTLFPFAAGFLPAVPEDYSFVLALAPWCVLPLLVGFRALEAPQSAASVDNAQRQRSARLWFFVAGVMGGFGLWISVVVQVPLLIGIGLGAIAAAWAMRPAPPAGAGVPAEIPPWRVWAWGGGLTVFVAYLVEYFPSHLDGWELRVIHPLYGIAWLGGGELLTRAVAWIQRGRPKWGVRDVVIAIVSAASLVVVPAIMWKTNTAGFLAVNLLSFRLTKQTDAALAPNFSHWLSRDGLTSTTWATVLPLFVVVVMIWMFLRRSSGASNRAALAVLLGPVVVAVAFAYFGLRWWQLVDGLLLIAAVICTAILCGGGVSVFKRWLWLGGIATVFAIGLSQLTPFRGTGVRNVLSLSEVEGLVERDLAHWLAKHSRAQAETIVLAPPSLTSALHFYGGMRGLGTFAWENKDGLSVAIRVAISTSREEAQALLRRREVTHIIIPSWSPFFDEYTRAASMQTGEMFFIGLNRWALPLWLRPIPYELPKISGFEQHSVVVLEVVDEQDEPVAHSRLAEYFLEMGQLDRAQATGEALRRFPADFGALVSRAQVAAGLGDATTFSTLLETIVRRLSSGADRRLPWDRRVSLAVALARGQRMDLARTQVQRCLAEIDEARIRSLTTFALFHLEFLRKSFGLEIEDPALRALITRLSPPAEESSQQ